MDIPQVRMPAFDALSTAGAKAVRGADAATGASSFASLIQQSLAQVNATQASAESMTQQWQLDPQSVSLEDAMLSVQKANISFQTTVQVRNKLVAAYNDIMNMQL